LDLATLTGHPEASGGGNGSGSGINSNGKDAYVLVGDFGGNTVWVTVLNADGTVRWSRNAADDKSLTGFNGTSAAIDELGQVVVVFSARLDPTMSQAIMGRRFDAEGNAVGGTFYVGETEIPSFDSPVFFDSDSPKVAWRDGSVAVTWFSKNYVDASLQGIRTIAYRLFLTGTPSGPSLSISTSGGNVTISWPADVTGFTLESSPVLGSAAVWTTVPGVANNSVVVTATGTRFYRLKQ
ncbi:MAG: hypothetical protein IH623_27455, partial [Verrucomicrobia bacterium]|nr:hypothetical protein [Verrucomicrobiota bacterium]